MMIFLKNCPRLRVKIMAKSDEIKVLSEQTDGQHHIEFICGEYCGVIFRLGAVSFSPDDECTMSYDYDILHQPHENFSIDNFEQHVGDIIVELIKKQLEDNDLIYTGGIDEN